MPEDREDRTIYKVVVNHEEQYSIWPAHRENALGWKDAGKETHVILFEPATTLNTGNVQNERTVANLQRI